jgi:hypothetical protein
MSARLGLSLTLKSEVENHSAEKLATLVVLIEEASVDFYDVARQPLKVTEIGMASAKIIDPQFDTKILQAEKCIPNGVRPFEQQTFRQLKNETLRRKASIAQNAGHRRYKRRLAQIKR